MTAWVCLTGLGLTIGLLALTGAVIWTALRMADIGAMIDDEGEW